MASGCRPTLWWMAKAELLDSSGDAGCGIFQVREERERRDSLQVLPVAFRLFSLFITFKHRAEGLGVSVTTAQTKTCLGDRASVQDQCKYVII